MPLRSRHTTYRVCEMVDGARLPVESSWRLAREALLAAALQSDGGTSAAGDDMRRSARGPPASAVMIAFFHSERMRPLVTVRPLVSTRTTTLEGPETEKKLQFHRLLFGLVLGPMLVYSGSQQKNKVAKPKRAAKGQRAGEVLQEISKEISKEEKKDI